MKKTFLIITSIASAAASSASGATVLNEPFSYSDGSLVTVSGGAWSTHSGTTPGQVDVVEGKVNINRSETEDVNASITGGIEGTFYDTGTLTATFDINFTELPTAGGAYFTHFKDAGFGFRGRLFSTISGAAAGTFRLAIADTTSAFAPLPVDLSLNTPYSVTLALDVATGRSSFSVNGGSVVTATDTTSFLGVSAFALRQNSGEGTLTFDNLLVDASAAVVPEPSTALMLVGGLGMFGGLRRLRRVVRPGLAHLH
jgi:hypothetical protein